MVYNDIGRYVKPIVKMKLFEVLSLLFTLTHVSYQANIQTKIVNGHEIDIKDYPYQALLIMSGELNETGSDIIYQNDYMRCGGSIISTKHILTAAHCLKEAYNGSIFTTKSVDVYLGSNIFEDGKKYVTTNWSIYFKYDDTPNNEYQINDLAIVILNEKIEFSKTVQAIRLPSSSSRGIDLAGQTVFVSGWGFMGPFYRFVYPDPISPQLRGTQMVLSDPKNCEIPSSKLCAIISDAMPGHTYLGDSGSPAVINNTLYGVASTIDALLPDTKRSHFTSVILYLDWIKETIHNH